MLLLQCDVSSIAAQLAVQLECSVGTDTLGFCQTASVSGVDTNFIERIAIVGHQQFLQVEVVVGVERGVLLGIGVAVEGGVL